MLDIKELAFEARLGLLIDREVTERENRRLSSRLRRAGSSTTPPSKTSTTATPGLDKSLIQSLASCQWVKEHLNILVAGPTGVGKTWLACALAQKACGEGHTALYLRLPRLLQEMAIAKGDGRYPKLLATLAKTEVLILCQHLRYRPRFKGKRLVICFTGQQRPNHSGILGHQRHRSLVKSAMYLECSDPATLRIVTPSQMAHHCSCPMNQEGTQTHISPLCDPAMAA